MHRLITGEDDRVAAWAFETWGCVPFHVNLAVGLANDAGELVGAFAFSGYNGSDAEVHVYSPGLLTRRLVRLIMAFALLQLDVNRLTARTRTKSMARGVQKLGAVFECDLRRMCGATDDERHTAKQFAFLRETIEKLAGMETTNGKGQAPGRSAKLRERATSDEERAVHELPCR